MNHMMKPKSVAPTLLTTVVTTVVLVIAVILAGRCEGAFISSDSNIYNTHNTHNNRHSIHSISNKYRNSFVPTMRRNSNFADNHRRLSTSLQLQPNNNNNINNNNNKSSTGSTSTSSRSMSTRDDNDTNNNGDDEMGLLAILGFVVPLLSVYISNQWSRSSIYYLVDFSSSAASSAASAVTDAATDAATATSAHAASFYAMNLDIGFNQAQYGALASIAFTTLFAITSLFAGSLADKYNRKYLTIGSTVIWSIATYTTSIATSYESIVLSRIIMGLACAFTTPCAYTLLKDRISNSQLSFANSIYGSGVYFGGGLSSLSILLDENIGWRDTYGIIAAYGVGVALVSAFLLPNDPKGAQQAVEGTQSQTQTKAQTKAQAIQEETVENSLFTDVQQIITSSQRLQLLFLGSFLRFCSGLCIGVWAAPYYKLAFPDDASSYAVINAFIVGICGVSSGLLGGYISDKSIGFINGSGDSDSGSGSGSGSNGIGNSDSSDNTFSLSTLDENGARLIVPIIGSLLAVPAWWLTSHASTFDAAMSWLAIEYLVAECWFGPTVAVLQSEVKKGQGGVAQGLFTLTGAVGNLAPSLLGLLYSRQIIDTATAVSGSASTSASDSDILSTLLGVGVCGGYLLSAICFGFSALSPPSPSTESDLVKSR